MPPLRKPTAADPLPPFFTHPSSPHTKPPLDALAATLAHPTHTPAPHPWPHQGWCSYSVLLLPRNTTTAEAKPKPKPGSGEPPLLLQFRPRRHRLPLTLMAAAARIYGASVVPRIAWVRGVGELELQAVAMAVLPGVPYSGVQVRRAGLDEGEAAWQARLVRGFAGFVAKGWRGGGEGGGGERVGRRLGALGERLPVEFRRKARRVGRAWGEVVRAGRLPVTVNHGDVVPGNLLVDGATGALTGVVDWAEAEVGVWGVGLYGLEFLLGFVVGESDVKPGVAWGVEGKGGRFGFTYYKQAAELRALFWEEVERGVGRAFGEPGVREAVDVVRDVGVLLMFGFAWDDGRIDRVVNASDDPREVMLLETFLGVTSEGEKARL